MRSYLVIFSLFVITLGLSVHFIEWSSPPLQLLEESRKCMLNAKRAGALTLAPGMYNQAQVSYDSAILVWNSENTKMKLFRNYELMEGHLNNAILTANLSKTAALEKERQYWNKNQARYEAVRDLYEYFKMTYSTFPLKEAERKKLAEARLVLDEIQLTLKNKSSREVDRKLGECEAFINDLINSFTAIMENYFKDFELWESLQVNALKLASKNNENVLIIDKLNRECKIYYRSQCIATFPVELGYNWIGDKVQSGDKTTPEGIYKVIKKKSSPDTKFYKALLLNYPNEDDRKRHKLNITNGSIPKNSAIGGDIEIHGFGGKGIDWTDGCIALSNEDMDSLYSIISTNTAVVIVGSTKPLEDVLHVR
ncbi:MAG: L,D-transpeptidase [Fulvivirga sp.]